MLFFQKPTSLIINNKIIFCNIRFINNQLLLTGSVYLYYPFDYSKISLYVNDKKTEFKIIERRNNEPSVICLSEDTTWINIDQLNISIIVNEKEYRYKINKEYYNQYQIMAMTLFKNDYRLMELYVDYYKLLGVECFYFYYNGEIDVKMFDFIKDSKSIIYIMEWNYVYWYNNTTHHHAQTMAIMDSLYLMKNITKYCLYNDFDEYIFPNLNLKELILKFPEINNFSFLCHWGTIGNELVSYEQAKESLKNQKILIKPYPCSNRKKSLIRVQDIEIMGIHGPHIFNTKNEKLEIPGFYHICNFVENDRRYFMNHFLHRIAVYLNGGLGNRLFQIAFIYSHAKIYNKKDFEFGYFISNKNDHSKIDYNKEVYPFIKKLDLGPKFIQISEKQNECMSYVKYPEVYECQPTLYIGYFQCEKYFKEYRQELIKLFSFPPVPFEIKQPSMFIHIRRGDYINNENHYVDLSVYYEKALQIFKSKFDSFKLYVISDDINYCIELKLFQNIHQDIEYITNLNELQTISLMKSCNLGGICSNSSFSWWGSYLNESKEKIIIFPSKWFANKLYQTFPNDIYFEGSYVMDINTFETKKI